MYIYLSCWVTMYLQSCDVQSAHAWPHVCPCDNGVWVRHLAETTVAMVGYGGGCGIVVPDAADVADAADDANAGDDCAMLAAMACYDRYEANVMCVAYQPDGHGDEVHGPARPPATSVVCVLRIVPF